MLPFVGKATQHGPVASLLRDVPVLCPCVSGIRLENRTWHPSLLASFPLTYCCFLPPLNLSQEKSNSETWHLAPKKGVAMAWAWQRDPLGWAQHPCAAHRHAAHQGRVTLG